MNKRASLPGASELFRLTGGSRKSDTAVVDSPAAVKEKPSRRSNGNGRERAVPSEVSTESAPKGSGRQKHDAKITVYVSGDELLAMEHARLSLRGEHGLVVDRGRLVREAMAILLADFNERGSDSVIVSRLRAGGVGPLEAER